MLFRLLRGRVLAGHEDEFVELLRKGVQAVTPVPGLLTLMAGYRRVEGKDDFVIASAWQSEADAVRYLGDDPLRAPRPMLPMAADVEGVHGEHYRLLEPVHRGLLDAPGAVLRVSSATLRPGRLADLEAWMRRKSREINASQLLLGWASGVRQDAERTKICGVTAWASPLQIEAIAEEGRQGRTLFAALDEFVDDFAVEQYQAIELRLPQRLAKLGLHRLIVARFSSGKAAHAARAELLATFGLDEVGVSVARLAHEGDAGQAHVLVARVALVQHGAAERLIADQGGQIVYEADEGRGRGAGAAYAGAP